MPEGKAAGQACAQLDAALRCRLFGQDKRPAVCVSLKPEATMCGIDRAQALHTLMQWERQTAPAPGAGDARTAA